MVLKPENPLVGGTTLRRQAIESPNFVTGVAGWIIRQDGSVEFNNGIFRGFIVGGSLFIYSGMPAFGNLIGSTAPPGTTDPFGNTVIPGTASYSGVFAAQLFGGILQLYQSIATSNLPATLQANATYAGELDISSGSAAGGDTTSVIELFSQLNTDPARQFTSQSEIDIFTQQLFANGAFSLLAGNGPFVKGEAWNVISNAANFSGTMRVKLVPWLGVWIDVEVTYSGTASVTANFGSLPSAAYYPTTGRQLPLACTTATTTLVSPFRLFVPTSGSVQLIVPGTMAASGASFSLSTVYPTN